MCPATSSARKLIMFAVLFTMVNGECPAKCKCWAYRILCSKARLNALPTRLDNTIQRVKIEFDNITQIRSTAGLQNLIHLELYQVHLKKIEPGAFQNMSRLEYLKISANSIRVLKRNSFKYLENLRFLEFTYNGLTRLEAGTFSGLKNLRILIFESYYMRELKANAFQGMRQNEINIGECGNLFNYSNIEARAFKYLFTLGHFIMWSYTTKPIPTHISYGIRIESFDKIEYVNRDSNPRLYDLPYLHISLSLKDLKHLKFQNFTKLTHLDLSRNYLEEISSGDFEGLVSLKTLDINNNLYIKYLGNGTFRSLESLETLNISDCHLTTIEIDAFQGLYKLRILDLGRNYLRSLNNYSFSTLRMLKELKLEGNKITHINYRTFSHLRSLKSLSEPIPLISSMKSVQSFFIGSYETEFFHTLHQTAFINLPRLDNLILFRHVRISKDIQVLKSLNLHIDAGYYNPEKELRRVLQTVHYIRNLSVTLYNVNSTQIALSTLLEFPISNLKILCMDLENGQENRLIGLSMLKSLKYKATDLETLSELHIYNDFILRYIHCSFLGLENFKITVLHIAKSNKTECLQRSLFQGVDNLSEINLMDKGFTCLKPGAFEGLNKIEKIDLRKNKIGKIEAGIFGALCKDGFEMSCKNITLAEYCNTTNALTALKYLNLAENNISFVHPHAFISCTNLHTLVLSENEFLTLDNPFLYTPALRKLGMSWCSVINIPNNTFDCTPLITVMDFSGNYISNELADGLKPGTFEGLGKIEAIDLRSNRIEKIEAGVFGALCKDAFENSCKIDTLTGDCNNTNALSTLKYLDLSYNNISFVHPQAFISCWNLEALRLSGNELLTLDNPFLYTPRLRYLEMSGSYISNIPNHTFDCTPMLHEVDFSDNRRLSIFAIRALLPLKHLKYLELTGIDFSCDFHFCESWALMTKLRIDCGITCNSTKYGILHSGSPYMTKLLHEICNDTNNVAVPQNRTTDVNDFAIFEEYIEPVVLIAILISGALCNGLLLFISVCHSHMRTRQNACVIHLAAVDLFSLLLNLPISYWDVANVRWEFDDTLCKIFTFSKDVIVGVNAFSVVALSVERFLVARNYNNLNKICKSESQPTVWLLTMTWISGIVTSLPAYFSAVFQGRCLYCPPGNQEYIRNVWTFQLIMYCILPAAAITFLNIKTWLFLRESLRKIPGEIKNDIRAKNRKKVANTVLILVPVFIASYLPNYTLRSVVAWSLVDSRDVFLLSFFTYCLFFCNTVFNPISIFIMSSKFKRCILSYFPFLGSTQNSCTVPVLHNRNTRRHRKF